MERSAGVDPNEEGEWKMIGGTKEEKGTFPQSSLTH